MKSGFLRFLSCFVSLCTISIVPSVYCSEGQVTSATQGASQGKTKLAKFHDMTALNHWVCFNINGEAGIVKLKKKIGYGVIARLGANFCLFNSKTCNTYLKQYNKVLYEVSVRNRWSIALTATPVMTIFKKCAVGPVVGLKLDVVNVVNGENASKILSIPFGLEVIAMASNDFSVAVTYRYDFYACGSKVISGAKCGNHYAAITLSYILMHGKSGMYCAVNGGFSYNCRKFTFSENCKEASMGASKESAGSAIKTAQSMEK